MKKLILTTLILNTGNVLAYGYNPYDPNVVFQELLSEQCELKKANPDLSNYFNGGNSQAAQQLRYQQAVQEYQMCMQRKQIQAQQQQNSQIQQLIEMQKQYQDQQSLTPYRLRIQ